MNQNEVKSISITDVNTVDGVFLDNKSLSCEEIYNRMVINSDIVMNDYIKSHKNEFEFKANELEVFLEKYKGKVFVLDDIEKSNSYPFIDEILDEKSYYELHIADYIIGCGAYNLPMVVLNPYAAKYLPGLIERLNKFFFESGYCKEPDYISNPIFYANVGNM